MGFAILLLVLGAVALALYYGNVTPEPFVRALGIIFLIAGALWLLIVAADVNIEDADAALAGFVALPLGLTAMAARQGPLTGRQAADELAGVGGPPQAGHPDDPESSLKPTNKLLSAALTAAVLYGLSLLTEVDPQLEQAVNVIVPVIVAYFTKNAKTPGGVPLK